MASYKDTWDVPTGEILQCQKEVSNVHDFEEVHLFKRPTWPHRVIHIRILQYVRSGIRYYKGMCVHIYVATLAVNKHSSRFLPSIIGFPLL